MSDRSNADLRASSVAPDFRGTVLIADDDPGIQDYYRKIFGSDSSAYDLLAEPVHKDGPDLDCRVFGSGDELVAWYFHELAEGRSSPVCILDMRMPGMNGMETASRLRAIDPCLEIVLCSAYGDVTIEQIRARLHDGFYYVSKPFSRGEFFLLVQSLAIGWNRKVRLAEREERFRSVVRALGDGVILLDRQGRILESNAQGRHLLGLKGAGGGEDRVLQTMFVDQAGQGFPSVLEPFRKTFETGESTRNLVLGVLAETSRPKAWLMANAEAVWGEGDVRPHAVVLSLHDISDVQRHIEELRKTNIALDTARREAEQGLEAARKATEAKNLFFSNMSREIRSPMGAILGLSDILAQGVLDPEQKRFASLLRGSGEALLSILNDIFDYSKIEAGKLSLENVEFDLRGLLQDVAEAFAVQADAKGLALLSSIEGDAPSMVRGDPGRIRQILSNLLSNAVKFTSSGEVRLSTSLHDAPDGRIEVVATVSDSGPGIDAERYEMLFEPSVQTELAMRRFGGTGIGLVIARGLLEIMDGSIKVESALGEGSVFQVRFLLRRTDAAHPAPEKEADVSLEGSSVLVADSRESSRDALSNLVRQFGCSTESVASLETLRSALRSGERWDAVVVDRSFVRDDPAGWLAVLAAQIPSLPPFLLVTQMGVRGEAGEAARAGWRAYLTRPIHSRLLRAALERCVAEKTASGNILTRHSLEESFRQGMRILATEESEESQLRIRRIIDGLGQVCTVASSGREFLAAIQDTPFDLVLLDTSTSLQSGLQTARDLRAGLAGNRCRDILLVALISDKQAEDACLEAGFDEVLFKPYSAREIAQLLRKIQESVDMGSEVEAP